MDAHFGNHMLGLLVVLYLLTRSNADIVYHGIKLPQNYLICTYNDIVYTVDTCFDKCKAKNANANGASVERSSVSVLFYSSAKKRFIFCASLEQRYYRSF